MYILRPIDTQWYNAELAHYPRKKTILEIKEQSAQDTFVGSPALMIQLLNIDLMDEFHICIHPIIEEK